jgi:presenilin-like A22 family membrane protease
MKTKTILKLTPIFWSIAIFIVSIVCVLLVASRVQPFLDEKQISLPGQPSSAVSIWPGTTTSPSGEVTQIPAVSSLGPILIYLFTVIIVLGVVLFIIPLSKLKLIFKPIYAFLFGWAGFVASILWLPLFASIGTALVVGLSWFFYPKVWLQSLVMVLAMVALGAVFGRFISPWTVMIIVAVLALYDFLAVRFGYMMWMANKLSETTALPAFVIPYRSSEWAASLKPSVIASIMQEKPEERKYSILGGGDIGFPLLLVASVYYSRGFDNAIIVAIFSLIGLVSAYWIQAKFLKGKAIPALPSIAVLSIIGLVTINLIH